MVERAGKGQESGKDSYSRAKLLGVIDYEGDKALLLFYVEDWGGYVLPICVDSSAAFSIRKAIENIDFPRPLTHDLLVNILEKLDVTVEKVTIDAMINNIYLATIVLRDNRTGQVFYIDSRPSDATAIAVRVGAPIYIADHLKKYAHPYGTYIRFLRKLRLISEKIEDLPEEEEEKEEQELTTEEETDDQ